MSFHATAETSVKFAAAPSTASCEARNETLKAQTTVCPPLVPHEHARFEVFCTCSFREQQMTCLYT